jgi:hypothetical protein
MSKAVEKKAPTKKPAPPKKSAEKVAFLKVYDSVRVKLAILLPDSGNPREMPAAEFEALIASLNEFGLVEPFVARAEDKRIVGGHQRALGIAEFLRRKGVAEDQIPEQEVTVVFVPGLSESKCRALNLALNRVHGKFDYTKMPDFLGGIDAGDILLTGFLDDEIKDILHLGSMPPPDEGDPDEYLANMQLKFDFKVANADEAAAVREVLTSYGMTGPKDASAAFVLAFKAAAKKKRPVAAE